VTALEHGMTFLLRFVVILAVLLPAFAAKAQDWPTRTVKLVVPYAAGGIADRLGRLLASELTASLGQQFVVENRAGNAGVAASAQVAGSAPDGYTLLIAGSGPHVSAPITNPNVTYDPLTDFTHIAMVGGDGYVFVVNLPLGVPSVAELVRLAKAKPVTTSSPGAGSLGHLLVEQFNRKAGITLEHVPYRGASDIMSALLGDHISTAMQAVSSVSAQVRAGKLKAIGVTGTERHPAFNDVPTFAEAGYPDVRGSTWFWLAAPKGLPPAIAAKLAAETRRIMALPKIKENFAATQLLSADMDPATLHRFIADELAFFRPLAKEVGPIVP